MMTFTDITLYRFEKYFFDIIFIGLNASPALKIYDKRGTFLELRNYLISLNLEPPTFNGPLNHSEKKFHIKE